LIGKPCYGQTRKMKGPEWRMSSCCCWIGDLGKSQGNP
jgi:hypothetical protein